MKKEVSLVFRGVTLHSPLISVVLVTRQHADTLRLRLDGILNQRTTFDTEVVIVDRMMGQEIFVRSIRLCILIRCGFIHVFREIFLKKAELYG